MYKKILVPNDGSPDAAAASKFACELLAGGIGQSVTLLVVASIAKALKEHPKINPTRTDEGIIKSQLKQAGQQIISQTQAIFEQKGLSANALLELCDDPGERILQIAKEQNFDLIVMGNRGRSPVKELIMGSVSTKVLRNAECPVVIYKD